MNHETYCITYILQLDCVVDITFGVSYIFNIAKFLLLLLIDNKKPKTIKLLLTKYIKNKKHLVIEPDH